MNGMRGRDAEQGVGLGMIVVALGWSLEAQFVCILACHNTQRLCFANRALLSFTICFPSPPLHIPSRLAMAMSTSEEIKHLRHHLQTSKFRHVGETRLKQLMTATADFDAHYTKLVAQEITDEDFQELLSKTSKQYEDMENALNEMLKAMRKWKPKLEEFAEYLGERASIEEDAGVEEEGVESVDGDGGSDAGGDGGGGNVGNGGHSHQVEEGTILVVVVVVVVMAVV
jgi:hypothetical protein